MVTIHASYNHRGGVIGTPQTHICALRTITLSRLTSFSRAGLGAATSPNQPSPAHHTERLQVSPHSRHIHHMSHVACTPSRVSRGASHSPRGMARRPHLHPPPVYDYALISVARGVPFVSLDAASLSGPSWADQSSRRAAARSCHWARSCACRSPPRAGCTRCVR